MFPIHILKEYTSLRAMSYCVMPEVVIEQSHLYLQEWNHQEKHEDIFMPRDI